MRMKRSSSPNAITRTVLPNGLTVILKEDHSNPVVAINVWFRTGSGHEADDESGLAHFQEHMVFKGTERHGVGEIPDLVKSAGGNLNAGTSYSYTSYYVVLPSRSFLLGLEIQADAMMNSVFDPGEFDKERLVVIEEARMYDDTPDSFTYYRAMELGFTAHNYRRPIAGYEPIVSAFTRNMLVDFYRRYYRPENAILVVVGDVEKARAVGEIEGVYGGWPSAPVVLAESPVEPPQKAFRFAAHRGTIDHAYLRFGFHVPNILDRDYPALEVLSTLLGSGKSSRLYQRVREEKRLVTTASTDLLVEKWPGYLMVAASMPADKWEKARDAVFAEVMRFAGEPVSEGELVKARRQVEKSVYSDLETVEGQASTLGYYEVLGDYRLAEKHRKALHRVTARQVMAVARRYLKLKNCSLVAYLPEEAGAADPSRKRIETVFKTLVPARTKTPAGQVAIAASASKASLPDEYPRTLAAKTVRRRPSGEKEPLRRLELPNGIRVLIRRRTTVPLVSVLTVCEGGTRSEPKGKSGLSLLATRALLKGSRSYAADEIVETVEGLGGNIESFSGFDFSGVYVNVLRDHLEPALRVYKDVLRHPSFVHASVEEERKRLLEELAKRHDHPVLYSIDHLFANLFGDHPYSKPFVGNEAELAALASKDCAEWHRRNIVAANTVVAMVGDIGVDEAMEAAGELFGDLAAGPAPVLDVEPLENPVHPGFHELRREGLHQAVGLVGFLAPRMQTKDSIALRALDGLMTGLGGRLFVELRDKRSLGYMAGSAFMPLKERSVFYGYTNPKPDSIDEAIGVILDELTKVTSEHVLDKELTRSKEWLVGSQTMKLQRNLAQALEYGYYEALGFGYETVERVAGQIQQVTVEDIRTAAASVFDRDKAVCIKLVPSK